MLENTQLEHGKSSDSSGSFPVEVLDIKMFHIVHCFVHSWKMQPEFL